VNVFEGDERQCVIEHILFDFSSLWRGQCGERREREKQTKLSKNLMLVGEECV